MDSPEFNSHEYSELRKTILKEMEKLPDLQVIGKHIYKRVRFRHGVVDEETDLWKLWLPSSLTNAAVLSAHQQCCDGGYMKTLFRIRQLYYWPSTAKEVKDFVAHCDDLDGVALGAAATTSHQDVEIIVFLAIMLHKAPAAFGLVSFLLHEKVERFEIRKHLAIFSLSAPLLTILTYFCIGQEQKETLNSMNATGIAMLFSAGTFLYVATVHVLPELTQNPHESFHSHTHYDYRPLENPIINSSTQQQIVSSTVGGLSYSELIIMICGTLLPLLITFGHQH
ncbi:zinc/iron regulated transporter-related protein 102B [Haematobia irritans]|uniref:zinc/iron regulated transporter-related protein 102B n=1 Tax=Haematobia irritans TaxID=7368 RepID=UPI003F500D52